MHSSTRIFPNEDVFLCEAYYRCTLLTWPEEMGGGVPHLFHLLCVKKSTASCLDLLSKAWTGLALPRCA
eukprot:12430164-Karenia_brevis.AAC.1